MDDHILQRMIEGEANITLDRLREIVDYDPETGFFTRKRPYGGPIGSRAGSYTSSGHRLIRIDNRNYREHRLAWLWVHGEFPKTFIDHKNGIRDDNRIDNLRVATRSVNQQNQRKAQKHNSTGFLGVSFARTKVHLAKRFEARISINKRLKSLGYFSTAEEAHAAYVEAKRRHHEGCTL